MSKDNGQSSLERRADRVTDLAMGALFNADPKMFTYLSKRANRINRRARRINKPNKQQR